MSNKKIINKALTVDNWKEIFKTAGVRKGDTLEVHSSMRGFGYTIGGAQSIVDALLDTVGYEGTVVMMLHDINNTEPSTWENPPVVPKLWAKIRETTPAFDPIESDTSTMGNIVNNFRRRQGVYFTRHPSCAFVAYGKYAKLILSRQNLNYPLNSSGPLGRMVELKARVLLLGVDYDQCTGMHLGEYLSKKRPVIVSGGAIDRGNGQEWVKYLDLDLDSSDFPAIGLKMEEDQKVKVTQVNNALIRYFRLSDAVKYTKNYLVNEKESE